MINNLKSKIENPKSLGDPAERAGESGQGDPMKAWSDGVVESWSVGSVRLRASLQYSN